MLPITKRAALLVAKRVIQQFYFPGSPLAVYSLRLAVRGYAGYCVQLRRSSDNTTANIGFGANKMVDTVAAATFAAGSTLYVVGWYDQSGNSGQNVTQIVADSAFQPQFVIINNTPWIAFGYAAFLEAASVGNFALTGDQTVGCVMQNCGTMGGVPVGCTDGSLGWAFFNNGVGGGPPGPTPGVSVYWTNSGSVNSSFPLASSIPLRMVTTRASGALTIYSNGTVTGTGTGLTNSASTYPFQIGQFASFGLPYQGLMGEVFVYASAIPTNELQAIDANQATVFPFNGYSSAFNGTSAVQFGNSEMISLGDVMDYERTAPWTAFVATQCYSSLSANGDITLFSNIDHNNPDFPGFGVWYLTDGSMIIRLVNNLDSNIAIDVRSAPGVNLFVNGKQNTVVVSYDGSSTAAGVKAYMNGSPVTLTTFIDGLNASIVASGQVFGVGCQVNDPFDHIQGNIGFFQMDTIVRNAAYCEAFTSYATIPANDATHTACRFTFSEGSGATVHDTGAVGNGFNGTLTSQYMWIA